MKNLNNVLTLALLAETNSLSQSVIDQIESGHPLQTIYLNEKQVFPSIIPAQPATARKSRSTGTLFGRIAPMYVKMNRNVFYRLSDVLKWLDEFKAYDNTAHHIVST